jgi:hypothetical protein
MGSKRKGLTELEERFCLKYFENGGNGTRAVLDAGYKQTEHAAATTANRLLKKAEIDARLAELRAAQQQRVENNADDIIRELKRMGYSDLRGLLDDNGAVLPPKQWPDDLARAVASIKVREEFEDREAFCEMCSKKMHRVLVGYIKDIRFWPKDKALHLLGLNKKLFTEKVEHDVTEDLAAVIAESRARARLETEGS